VAKVGQMMRPPQAAEGGELGDKTNILYEIFTLSAKKKNLNFLEKLKKLQ
jgi:hypothetical protein